MDEQEWQPVRIAPLSMIKEAHPNTDVSFWTKQQGKLVFARCVDRDRIIGGLPTCKEGFEMRQDCWMDDGTGWPVMALCEHQILAD